MATGSSIFHSSFGQCNKRRLRTKDFQNDEWFVTRLNLEYRIKAHTGCVNTLCWTSDSGAQALLSGSDDRRLVVTDAFTRKELVAAKTSHGDNIFTARFLPYSNDTKVVSCAGDGTVLVTDLQRWEDIQALMFNCANEAGPVYECRPACRDCPQVFLTCAEDGVVRRYDMRVCNGCCQNSRANPFARILSRLSGGNLTRLSCCRRYGLLTVKNAATTSIDLAEGRNTLELAVGCSDGKVRLYDMRNARRPFAWYALYGSNRRPLMRNKCQVTCVRYNENGHELLASFAGNQLHLLDPTYASDGTASKIKFGATAGTTTDETENEHLRCGENEARRIKRIRLRGDWTDTGPMARPNRESVLMIRRLSNVFNNLGLSPPASSSTSSSSSSAAEEDSSGDARQSDLNHLLQSLVRRLSVQATLNESSDDEGRSSSFRRNPDDTASSEPDYDDDDYDEDDEGVLNAESHVNDMAASNGVRHRARRPPSLLRNPSLPRQEPFMLESLRTYTGHRNSRTIIKECAFFGDRFVMSGSDCGHLFVWDKQTSGLLAIYLADQHVVNCVQPHPSLPVVATSGIDHDFKLWVPSSREESDDTDEAEMQRKKYCAEVVDRNREMLQESQNTITVSDPLFLRLLTTIGSARRYRQTSSPSRAGSSASGQ